MSQKNRSGQRAEQKGTEGLGEDRRQKLMEGATQKYTVKHWHDTFSNVKEKMNVKSMLQAASKTFVSLKDLNYRYLWTGLMGSWIAMQMQQVARGYLAYRMTGTAVALGWVTLSMGVPRIVLSPLGGVLADRFPKRQVILWTQALQALIALSHAILIQVNLMSVHTLVVLGFLQGVAFSLNMPARQAIIPEMLGSGPSLANAIALNNAGVNMCRVVGPSVAGILLGVTFIDVKGVFFIMFLCYTWALYSTSRISMEPKAPSSDTIGARPDSQLNLLANRQRNSEPNHRTEPRSDSQPLPLAGPQPTSRPRSLSEPRPRKSGRVMADVGTGFQAVLRNPNLLSLMSLGFIPLAVGMPYQNIMPVFALKVMELSTTGLGALLTVVGIGGMIGSLLVAYLSEYPHKAKLQLSFGVSFGILLVLFAAFSRAKAIVLVFAVLFLIGIVGDGYMSINSTLIMTNTERSVYGRVMGIYMIIQSVRPIAVMPFSALADAIGAPMTVGLSGAFVAIFVLAVALLYPRYKEIG